MKLKSIARLAVMSFLLVSGAALAEALDAGTITGTIYDLKTGDPVVGAWVSLLGANRGATTDSAGRFVIERVTPGTYTLEINHPDYSHAGRQSRVEVIVGAGTTTTVSLPLTGSLFEALADQTGNYKYPSDRLSPQSEASDKKEDECSTSGSLSVLGIPTPAPRIRSSGSAGWPSGYYSPQKERSCQYPGEDYPSLPPFDMFFRDYGTNGFVVTRHDRLSTFAADVDDASYTLIRRYLTEGNLPPREAVRVEEFINHFDYGYNPPEFERFRVFTEMVASPFSSQATLLKIGVKGREVEGRNRIPLNLTLVIDVSGSMGYDNRMQLLKQSLRLLISQLNRHDRIGIVAYGSRAHVVLEPIPADRRQQIEQAINSLHPGGSTNAEAGLQLGYQMADRQWVNGHTNRIILYSDGVANVGRTSADAIMRQVKRCARRGIMLSTFGFGMGNYNDVLLEQLAQKGNGRYAYVNNYTEARKQFGDEFVSNMQVLARNVKIQVEFNPEVVASYRLLGYENRDIPDDRFRDKHQDGGEVGAGHEVTALYELVLNKRCRSGMAAAVFVRWNNEGETEVTELSREISLKKMDRRFDNARPELRLAVIAARFGGVLKGTDYGRDERYDHLLRLAESVARDLPCEQTRELADLIRRARDLSVYYTGWRFDEPGDADYKRRR